MENDANRDAFLAELTELTRKYGLVVGACGCCDSPDLTPLEDDAAGGRYVLTVPEYDAGLAWRVPEPGST